MRKKIRLLAGLIIVSAVLIIWYRATNAVNDPVQTTDVAQHFSSGRSISPAVAIQLKTSDSVQVKESIKDKLTDHFSVVATTYAGEINYPPYSTPLTSADSLLLEPNSYHAQIIPLEHHASASIQLERYRFIYPQPINVHLQLEAIQVYDVSLQVFDEQTNKLLATSKMQIDTKGYSAKIIGEASWDGPLRVEIEFKSGGQSQIIQTGFEYNQPVAKITGLGGTYTEGADLIIPVKLKVISAGHYRLRANLFKADHQPLAVLTTSAKLATGDSELKLRAYKSLIKGNTSPLWLGTFQLENRSAAPGEPTRYGDSEKAEFIVEYSGVELFSEEDYQPDEEEKQRLAFLKQMAEQKQ